MEIGNIHEAPMTKEVMKGLYQTGKCSISGVLGSLLSNNWFPNIAISSLPPWVPSYCNPVFFSLNEAGAFDKVNVKL